MIRVGITGQSGFLGSHLFNTLGLNPEVFDRIPFRDDLFNDISKLSNFIRQCDVIVHLAAMNRNNDAEVIYRTNTDLVDKLIKALNRVEKKPHVLYSSSIQENRDNMYGKSKREGRELLAKWAKLNNALFSGLVLPNLFGVFGEPYYNSFIATFSHQLCHGKIPNVDVDASIPLLYVNDAVKTIIKAIKTKQLEEKILVERNAELNVSSILRMLNNYKELYLEKGIIPAMKDSFEVNLFNTFRSYIDLQNHYPVKLQLNKDKRGSFVETVKTNAGGQLSFSTTEPGITRGNHFHTRKIERFVVIKGQALIQLRKIGSAEVLKFKLEGEEPSFVDIPIWYTHNLTNIGAEDLYTIFWISEFYDPEDPDTFYEEVC